MLRGWCALARAAAEPPLWPSLETAKEWAPCCACNQTQPVLLLPALLPAAAREDRGGQNHSTWPSRASTAPASYRMR